MTLQSGMCVWVAEFLKAVTFLFVGARCTVLLAWMGTFVASWCESSNMAVLLLFFCECRRMNHVLVAMTRSVAKLKDRIERYVYAVISRSSELYSVLLLVYSTRNCRIKNPRPLLGFSFREEMKCPL